VVDLLGVGVELILDPHREIHGMNQRIWSGTEPVIIDLDEMSFLKSLGFLQEMITE